MHWDLIFCTKRCKKYSGPLLPPGGRNWQLIYPNSSNEFKEFKPLELLHAGGGACLSITGTMLSNFLRL
jgi:hypothetical protein